MRAVNLIPADQRSGASVGAGRSQGGAYAVLALAVGLALLAVLYGKARHDVSSQRAEVAVITAQAHNAQVAAEQLAPYTSFIALREQRAQAVNTLVDSRFDWAHAFHEFGRVLPLQTSIQSLTGTISAASTEVTASDPSTSSSSSSSSSSSAAASHAAAASTPAAAASTPVASATPPGSVPSFTLSGCSTSQRTVAQTLQRLRLMDGVSQVTLVSSTVAGGGSGSSGGGGCPPKGPAFTAQVTFDPLPSASAEVTATKTVATTSGVPR
jgi:hypothetical protein